MAVPEGPFATVSVGWEHACGLRRDDTVACWLTRAMPTPAEVRRD